jgi:hypothetical protein
MMSRQKMLGSQCFFHFNLPSLFVVSGLKFCFYAAFFTARYQVVENIPEFGDKKAVENLSIARTSLVADKTHDLGFGVIYIYIIYNKTGRVTMQAGRVFAVPGTIHSFDSFGRPQ